MKTILVASVLLTSCYEIRTNDPIESYKYWSGTEPTDDVRVLKGQYWQSAHWTREYILYLKIKPTDKWWDDFVKHNQLEIESGKWSRPSESPEWFQVPDNIELYKHTDDFTDSRYYKDTVTGECYIYEIQL